MNSEHDTDLIPPWIPVTGFYMYGSLLVSTYPPIGVQFFTTTVFMLVKVPGLSRFLEGWYRNVQVHI